MGNTDDLIELILANDRLRSGSDSSAEDNVYSDIPLLRRGSQVKPAETPPRIKEMKEMAFTKEAMWKTGAWLFYQQGTFMADYTDDFEYHSDFVKYYVTYSALSTPQLRGYFTWRTHVRQELLSDVLPETPEKQPPLPFVYLYAYELINGIGTDSPEQGLLLLKKLCQQYGAMDKELDRLLRQWQDDFVIYFGLDVSEMNNAVFDNNVLALMECQERTDDEVWSALTALSVYNVESSRFYEAYPDELKKAVIRVFRTLTAFFQAHRKTSLCTKLFGRVTEMNYRMFDGAVFYERNGTRNADVTVNDIHSYTCRSGIWRCRRIYGNRGRSGQLGDIIKLIDCIMRERYGFKYRLNVHESPKNMIAIINKVLDRLDEEKRLEAAAKVEIDLSVLSGIRADADVIRDKLLTDEELDDSSDTVENSEVHAEENTAEAAAESHEEVSSGLLEPSEIVFLELLLSGGDWRAAAREYGTMPSVIADSVNEKLFDSIGDNVIDFDGDTPFVIEDYIPDLKDIL